MPTVSIQRRWGIVAFAIAYTAFTYGLVAGGFTFWVGPWMHDFHSSHSLIMTVFTVASLVMIFLYPLVGRALDVLSIRAMLAIGSAVLAVGLILGALAPNFWLLFAVYATLIPIGATLTGALPGMVLAVRLFPGRTGLINGLMSLGTTLSAVAAAAFSAPLIGLVGWRGTFGVAAVVLLAVIAPLGWLLMHVPEGAPARKLKTPKTADVVSSEGFDALKQPVFWGLVLASAPIMLTLGAVSPNLAAVAADSGLNAANTALLVSMLAIGATGGSLVGGWLVDRLPPRTVYVGILIGVALALTALAFRPGLLLIVPAVGLLGFAAGSVMPWTATMVMRCFGPEAFGRVTGVLTPFYIPATLAPILFGGIRDATGGYQAAFLLFVALLTPGAVGLLMLRPKPAAIPVAAE